MAKLSKNTKTIIIAAAVLLVLGIVCLVLVMTEPKPDDGTTSEATSEAMSSESATVALTSKSGTEVLSLTITNEHGSYTFNRDVRAVSSTDSEGNVSTTDEYFWVSPEMGELRPNDTTLKAFMNRIAGLTANKLVEENAQELDKYGLAKPLATAKLRFADGSAETLHFGINNPASENFVYCCKDGSKDVYQVSEYSVGDVYSAITKYVSLTFTDGYNPEAPKELDYMVVERKDFDEPVEISYMFDIQEEAEDINSVITTFNSHRVTSPVVAEVDSTKGQTYCYGLYALTASSCVAVEADEELLAKTGLDDPFCTVTFKYGGKRNILYLGDEIVTTIETDNEGTPTLTEVVGYYGMLEGNSGVYAFSKDAAPWYTTSLEDIVSRRPVSPYIYTVDKLTITTPEREYLFTVTGNAEKNSFTIDGTELDGDKFRQLYQQLISAVGDELYLTDGEYEPYITVKFEYRDEYHEVYRTESDVLEFYQTDERKNIVRVNGKVLFKVRQIYTDRLLENIDALLNGGELQLNW